MCIYALCHSLAGRSREGAWIEIRPGGRGQPALLVAPVRERGLKLADPSTTDKDWRRSREGAWIEIYSIEL